MIRVLLFRSGQGIIYGDRSVFKFFLSGTKNEFFMKKLFSIRVEREKRLKEMRRVIYYEHDIMNHFNKERLLWISLMI